MVHDQGACALALSLSVSAAPLARGGATLTRSLRCAAIQTLPTLLKSAVSSSQTLVFVPSYFDFVRLKRYLTKHRSSLASDFSFAAISEYTPTPDVSRARGAFFAGKVKFLLVTERFHFFRRCVPPLPRLLLLLPRASC